MENVQNLNPKVATYPAVQLVDAGIDDSIKIDAVWTRKMHAHRIFQKSSVLAQEETMTGGEIVWRVDQSFHLRKSAFNVVLSLFMARLASVAPEFGI